MAVMLRQKGKVGKLFREVFGKQKVKKSKWSTIKIDRPYINLGYTQGYG